MSCVGIAPGAQHNTSKPQKRKLRKRPKQREPFLDESALFFANAPGLVLDTSTATNNRGLQSILPPRQHPCQNIPNRFRAMLASRTLKRIRPLKSIGSINLHLP